VHPGELAESLAGIVDACDGGASSMNASRMVRSKIDTRRSSLLLKYRYTVPAATPAERATSATCALKNPRSAKTSMAARKMASRLGAG